jgi:hypothetical protein
LRRREGGEGRGVSRSEWDGRGICVVAGLYWGRVERGHFRLFSVAKGWRLRPVAEGVIAVLQTPAENHSELNLLSDGTAILTPSER